MTYRPLTDAERAVIEELYADGESVTAIGRAIGRRDAPRRYLARRGLYEPTRRPLSGAKRARAIDLYQRGVRVTDISRRLCVSATSIYRVLRETNTPLRYPRLSAAMSRGRRNQEGPAP